MAAVVVYGWGIDRSFLVAHLAPEARVVLATTHDRVSDLLSKLCPDTKVLWLQVNLSLTVTMPPDRERLLAECAARGVRVINGGIKDITRRSVQERCRDFGLRHCTAAIEGDADEVVIVKTNFNSGGIPESWLTDSERSTLEIQAPCSHDYLVTTRGAVPAQAWARDDLVLERFVSNHRGLFYRAFVAGQAVVLVEAFSDTPIKKLRPDVRRRNLFVVERPEADIPLCPDVVDAVKRFSEGFGLDFGTLDVMVDDAGCPYVVDVNPTPHWGTNTQWRDPHGKCFGGILQAVRAGLGMSPLPESACSLRGSLL